MLSVQNKNNNSKKLIIVICQWRERQNSYFPLATLLFFAVPCTTTMQHVRSHEEEEEVALDERLGQMTLRSVVIILAIIVFAMLMEFLINAATRVISFPPPNTNGIIIIVAHVSSLCIYYVCLWVGGIAVCALQAAHENLGPCPEGTCHTWDDLLCPLRYCSYLLGTKIT